MSHYLDRAMAAGVLTVLFFATLAHGAVESWSIALFELMLILLMLLWGIKTTFEHRLHITIPHAALPIIGLLLLGTAQVVAFTGADGRRLSLSLDVEATRHVVLMLFFLAFAFLAAANFLVTRQHLLLLANALTVFGALLAAFALLQYFTWNGSFYWLRPTTTSAFGPFVNRNQFAGYMAMLVPVPVALLMRVVDSQQRLLYGFAAVLMGTAAIISNSRSGVVSLIASMVVITLLERWSSVGAVYDRASRSRFYQLGPVAVVAGAIIGLVLWIGASGIVEHFGDAVDQFVHSGSPDVGRAMIWRGTLNMIHAHPLLGVGLGAYITVFPTYETVPNLVRINYAHNDYLQVLAECGAVGGIILLWFVVAVLFAIWRGIRSRDPLRAAMSLAAGSGIIAILIQSVADSDMQVPSNALLFLILVAVVTKELSNHQGEINDTLDGPVAYRIGTR